jgi:hypothetical protein
MIDVGSGHVRLRAGGEEVIVNGVATAVGGIFQ